MLDLQRLERIELSRVPRVQLAVAYLGLMPNYELPPRVRIEFEGLEKVPDGPVIYAMNHTDRFNYFPFQYRLWRRANRYTATWVKGKYYEHPAVAAFMEWTNQLPTVSRGYIITKDFVKTMSRRPTDEEYGLLRNLVNAAAHGQAAEPAPEGTIPIDITTQPRDMLGYRFEPDRESYAEAVNTLFQKMMDRFIELNEEALAVGLDLLIFPEGTRSSRLSKGRIGLAQIAQHLRATIVPVGCNGSDKIYPTSNPIARSGRIVYRFGDPIPFESYPELHVGDDFRCFTPESEDEYRDVLQTLVDRVMGKINELLDPEYQFAEDMESQGVRGTNRFV